MSNDHAQTPTGGQTKMTKKIAKQKNENKKNENNNNDKSYNKKKNRYGGNSRTASPFDTWSKSFEGEESSIVVVLGLHFEKIDKRVPLNISRENMGN